VGADVKAAMRRAVVGLEDVGLVLLVAFLLPVAILVIGAPVAIVGWLLAAVAGQW
jgi:hypothetical protein